MRNLFIQSALIFLVGVVCLYVDRSGGYYSKSSWISAVGMVLCVIGIGWTHICAIISRNNGKDK